MLVRSGNSPVRVRRFAARSAGSSDFLPLRSGKLLEGVWLDDFEEPVVVLSRFGNIISGIWMAQLHFVVSGQVYIDFINLCCGGLHENPYLPRRTSKDRPIYNPWPLRTRRSHCYP